jgi:hypothetical protein
MSDYTRTRAGRVIHRSECPFVQLAALKDEWFWAQGHGPYWIVREFRELGLPPPRFCKHCIGKIAA